ncbi:uncharacterized protein EV154DRAFT_394144, partial [Mucor mucedo]|uniref:uncharacterized protein n=1 Tax=Mucor mucedo TaxID=29922 RepID=UPI00221EDF99
KVYPCSQCTKQFNRPSALETHSYTHSLEKPFQCLSPNCGRKFSVVSNLRRHFKVHQKQSLNCNKITSQERLRCVRQLIKKKPSD